MCVCGVAGVYTYIYIYTCMYTYKCICKAYVYKNICVYKCVRMYVTMYINIDNYIHIHATSFSLVGWWLLRVSDRPDDAPLQHASVQLQLASAW